MTTTQGNAEVENEVYESIRRQIDSTLRKLETHRAQITSLEKDLAVLRLQEICEHEWGPYAGFMQVSVSICNKCACTHSV